MDAQITYSFPDHSTMRGLSLFLQATNLGDEVFSTFLNNDPRQIEHYQQYGGDIIFGVSYKLGQ